MYVDESDRNCRKDVVVDLDVDLDVDPDLRSPSPLDHWWPLPLHGSLEGIFNQCGILSTTTTTTTSDLWESRGPTDLGRMVQTVPA